MYPQPTAIKKQTAGYMNVGTNPLPAQPYRIWETPIPINTGAANKNFAACITVLSRIRCGPQLDKEWVWQKENNSWRTLAITRHARLMHPC
jgi:hypothetical protein